MGAETRGFVYQQQPNTVFLCETCPFPFLSDPRGMWRLEAPHYKSLILKHHRMWPTVVVKAMAEHEKTMRGHAKICVAQRSDAARTPAHTRVRTHARTHAQHTHLGQSCGLGVHVAQSHFHII